MEIVLELNFSRGIGMSKTLVVIFKEIPRGIVITSTDSGLDMISSEEWKLRGNTSISTLIRTHTDALGVSYSLWQDWLSRLVESWLMPTKR